MKVAGVKVDTYSYREIEQGLDQALGLLGDMSDWIKPGDKVLIKPNMLDGLPAEKAVTTHPELIRAIIRKVKKHGAVPMVGDSPGVTSTLKAAEKCGILAVCHEERTELLPFDTTVSISCPDGLTVKKFLLASPLTEVDKVISAAKMKTHTFMGVTGPTKNLFGCIVGMQKAQFHLRMQRRQEFAGMLLDLARAVKPVLSIVDGIVGMEGDGPRNGYPVKAGILLAGTNCFAVDVVMAEIMGFDPLLLPVTALAIEKQLTPALANIHLVGDAQALRLHFIEPRSMQSLEDRLPKWIAELGHSQLTAKPSITTHCIACGRCVDHCPPQAMRMIGGRILIDYDKCIRCYCCQELCPENAVQVTEGLLLKIVQHFL
ncbi:MAG: hypothetical protein H6Q66_2313 [Firmicutes bacterium]|nr:hypothetical protein [Bacillota bacterium]